ncbi:uncharacterized protein LOC141931003 [Strix aluco]|uniref:uncharacterized protein LOC141931003 n=1 Tax=Strix aluco TaxID=111821 RepID=UPI003DA53406
MSSLDYSNKAFHTNWGFLTIYYGAQPFQLGPVRQEVPPPGRARCRVLRGAWVAAGPRRRRAVGPGSGAEIVVLEAAEAGAVAADGEGQEVVLVPQPAGDVARLPEQGAGVQQQPQEAVAQASLLPAPLLLPLAELALQLAQRPVRAGVGVADLGGLAAQASILRDCFLLLHNSAVFGEDQMPGVREHPICCSPQLRKPTETRRCDRMQGPASPAGRVSRQTSLQHAPMEGCKRQTIFQHGVLFPAGLFCLPKELLEWRTEK